MSSNNLFSQQFMCNKPLCSLISYLLHHNFSYMVVKKNLSLLSSNANSEIVALIRLCFVWRYKQGPFLGLFQATLDANTRSFALTALSVVKCIT